MLAVLRNSIYCITALIAILIISCQKNIVPAKDSQKEIISFLLEKSDGSIFDSTQLTISIRGDSINVSVPYNTDLTRLIPVIAIKGFSLSPASGVIQDFTLPVVYKVTAEDGTSTVYIVSIKQRDAPSGTVYIGSADNNFYALDAINGALKWKFSGTASFAYSGATYSKGTVYVGGIDGYVYAFDAINGTIKWRFQAGANGVESDAVVVDGTVYVGSNDHYLYAIDAASGSLRWKYLTGANVSSSPTLYNATVYFGSSDGKLYAVDKINGQLKWSFATGGMLNQSGPAISNGNIYVGSRDGYLYAIDLISGSLKWRFSSNGISFEQSSPTIANGVVYIGAWYDISDFTRAGSFYAIDANTGVLVWEKLQGVGISSSPTVYKGIVFITSDDLFIHALDAISGNEIWKKQILANSSSPAVSNGILYVGGGGVHNIFAFDAMTGAEKWRFNTSGLMTSCPLIVNTAGEAVYAGDSGMLN